MQSLHRLLGFAIIIALVAACLSLGGSLGMWVDIPSIIMLVGLTWAGLSIAFGPHAAVSAFVAACTGRERDPRRLVRHAHVLAVARQLAWGAAIVGMLAGLISMTANMSDMFSIGGSIAVALMIVLYAGVWAELIVAPLRAGLLRTLMEIEAESPTPPPLPTPASSSPGILPIAAGGLALLIVIMPIVMLSHSRQQRDEEYQEVLQAIKEQFGYTGGGSSTTRSIESPKTAILERAEAVTLYKEIHDLDDADSPSPLDASESN